MRGIGKKSSSSYTRHVVMEKLSTMASTNNLEANNDVKPCAQVNFRMDTLVLSELCRASAVMVSTFE